MINKILIINPFGIGDVIFSTPLVEIIKKRFPNSFIGYVCNKRVSELMLLNPFLDKIFIYEKDDFREAWLMSRMECARKIISFLSGIKREKFDISIDLSLNAQYSMLLWLIGIKNRVGLNYRQRGKLLTGKIDIEGFDNKHVVEYYLDVLKLLGINPDKYEIRPKIYVSAVNMKWAEDSLKENGVSKNDLLIGVIPGCGASWGADAKYRRWDKTNFTALAKILAEKHRSKIILLGNASEMNICESISNAMNGSAINYCGTTSIGRLTALISKCAAIITNDGGPLHMAVGLGVKTVSIFGPVNELVYGPYPPGDDHVIVLKKGLACRPCYKRFKYNKCENRLCLDAITVDEVLRAAEKVLAI